MDRHAVACLLVGLVIALNGKHRVDAVICPTLQPQTFTRCQAADATLAQNAVRIRRDAFGYRCRLWRLRTAPFGVAVEVWVDGRFKNSAVPCWQPVVRVWAICLPTRPRRLLTVA